MTAHENEAADGSALWVTVRRVSRSRSSAEAGAARHLVSTPPSPRAASVSRLATPVRGDVLELGRLRLDLALDRDVEPVVVLVRLLRRGRRDLRHEEPPNDPAQVALGELLSAQARARRRRRRTVGGRTAAVVVLLLLLLGRRQRHVLVPLAERDLAREARARGDLRA